MHVKRDSEAPFARALRKKTTAHLLSSSPCALPCVSVCSASRHVRQQAYHSRSSPFCVTCAFPPRDIDTCLRGSSFIPHLGRWVLRVMEGGGCRGRVVSVVKESLGKRGLWHAHPPLRLLHAPMQLPRPAANIQKARATAVGAPRRAHTRLSNDMDGGETVAGRNSATGTVCRRRPGGTAPEHTPPLQADDKAHLASEP